MTRAPLAQRFAAKVRVDQATGCWQWTGAVAGAGAGGYGTIRGEGRPWPMLKAHRVAYEIHRGPIPAGLVIDHLCMNKLCVNPAHLEPVTGKENSSRYAATITECRQGHPFSPDNTLLRAGGERICRACHGAIYRRWYHERGGKAHRRSQRQAAACVSEGAAP